MSKMTQKPQKIKENWWESEAARFAVGLPDVFLDRLLELSCGGAVSAEKFREIMSADDFWSEENEWLQSVWDCRKTVEESEKLIAAMTANGMRMDSIMIVTYTEDDISRKAEEMARSLHREEQNLDANFFFKPNGERVRNFAAEPVQRGTDWDSVEDEDDLKRMVSDDAQINKEMDPSFWRRRLRKKAASVGLLVACHLKMIGGEDSYCDKWTTARFRERQEKAADWARSKVQKSSTGDIVTMEKIMEASKKAATSRIYAQLMGMQEIGEQIGLLPIFVTITLLPEWHPNPSMGECSWNGQSLEKAKKQIQEDYRKYNRRLHKAGIEPVFGIRMLEPQKDGTPHLHILKWVRAEDVRLHGKILKKTLPGKHRTDLKIIRAGNENGELKNGKKAAKPITYIMKYIMKSLNDELAVKQTKKDGKEDMLNRFDEVRAWASAVGARRWGLIGVHGVQKVWQTIWNWPKVPDGAPDGAAAAWNIMHGSEIEGAEKWAETLRALGAIKCEEGTRVRICYEEQETKYGDVRKVPAGLTDREDGEMMCRLSEKTWEMIDMPKAEDHEKKINEINVVALVDSYPRQAPPAVNSDDVLGCMIGNAVDHGTIGWAPMESAVQKFRALEAQKARSRRSVR